MARCPYLDWKSTHSIIGAGQYSCKLAHKNIEEKAAKDICKKENSEAYKSCPIYQKR